IGWMAKALSRARMVYYSLELYGEQHNHLRWWWKPFEGMFVKHAIHSLITQNKERAKIYELERGSRVKPTIVHNYKPFRKVIASGKLREQLNLAPEVRVVLYEGMLGRGRWLENLALSAVHLPSEVRLVFMGKPSEWWCKTVQPILARPGIAGKVLVSG